MEIEKIRDVIENCRFCSMCRHICTVGRQTRNETDTPRGKALNLWTVLRGMRDYSMEDAEVIFRCVGCGACKQWCVSGYDVPAEVEAARVDMINVGLIPEVVKDIRNDILERGNPFGKSPVAMHDASINGLSMAKGKDELDVLVFPGCEVSYNAPEVLEKVRRILESIGISYAVLDYKCCGGPLKSLGFYEDARKVAGRLAVEISDSGAKLVLTLCPGCLYSIKNEYVEIGVDLFDDIEVRLFDEYVLENIKSGRIVPRECEETTVVVHDPCSTGRKLGMYQLPRDLLSGIKSIEQVELLLNKENSPCCGGNVLSRRISPKIASAASSEILNEALELNVKMVVTTCPSCRVSFNTCGKGIRAVDPVELIAL